MVSMGIGAPIHWKEVAEWVFVDVCTSSVQHPLHALLFYVWEFCILWIFSIHFCGRWKLYGTSTVWHANDVHVGRFIGIACADDVGDGNFNHWHADDISPCMANSHWSSGSTWNLKGKWGEKADSPGNWGKTHVSRSGCCQDPGWCHQGMMDKGQTEQLGAPTTLGHRSGMT